MTRRARFPEPTADQLRMAWPFFFNRGSCPDTIEAALAHPVWGPCLRRAAQRFGRAIATGHVGAAAAAAANLGTCRYVPPTPTAPPRVPTRTETGLAHWPAAKHQPIRTGRYGERLGTHDAKRAAANDRDDQDAAA